MCRILILMCFNRIAMITVSNIGCHWKVLIPRRLSARLGIRSNSVVRSVLSSGKFQIYRCFFYECKILIDVYTPIPACLHTF